LGSRNYKKRQKMKLVIDTNILFSFFNENSFTKKLITNPSLNLISPEFSLTKLKKYSELIIKKSKISKKTFEHFLKDLKTFTKFINNKIYLKYLDNAQRIAPDEKDKDFLALSLKENCPLWSNDKELKKQSKIKVFSTKELIELLF